MIGLDELLTRNRERLQGIRGWDDVARLGRTNLRRLRELLAEDATAELASGISFPERQAFGQVAEALRDLEARSADDKPCLVRFRVESFRAGDSVQVYVGDTPTSRIAGWICGNVVSVEKAHRPDWNDGSPNAGYYWEVSLAVEPPIFSDGSLLRCSTSEPRVQQASDHRALLEARDRDPEFFRIFTDNAQRSLSPLWCLERGLRVSAPDVRSWFGS